MNIEEISGETTDADLAAGTAAFSIERAKRIVATFAQVTTSQDASRFVEGFTEDCIVNFPPGPSLVGRVALKAKMEGMFKASRQRFVCEKRLRSVSGNVLGVVWVNRWHDADTRKDMMSKGVEFWLMRGEQIARWDACTTAWEV